MGRDYKRSKSDAGRDAGGFAAIPWSVLDCPSFVHLSHPAKSLLLEIARQFVRDNNGKLLCSMSYLRPRGWKSADVVQRAKNELLAAGFIFETCKGHRPNKASWYAVTWRSLDKHYGYDIGAVESFERGAYRKNTSLIPLAGKRDRSIAPPEGIGHHSSIPSHGSINARYESNSSPSNGNHLDKPSANDFEIASKSSQRCHETLAELWRSLEHASIKHKPANVCNSMMRKFLRHPKKQENFPIDLGCAA